MKHTILFCVALASEMSSIRNFAVLAQDKPSHTQLRAATRAAHLEWVHTAPVQFAGPLMREGSPVGSLLLMSGTLEKVRESLSTDPYAKAGLFENVQVYEWDCVLRSPSIGSELFCSWRVNRPEFQKLREQTQEQHLKWWRDAGRKGMTGSLKALDNGNALGTLTVCEAEKMDDFSKWLRSDTYSVEGTFLSEFFAEFKKVLDKVFVE